ncbi:Calponin like (CH) domain [Trypanosoma vivax]|uniref:Calponin-homology (CH) domain-containing protein n=1 Tax=Trypanosoma vivax (strain Y486) TaxID=1055687 RepID=G0TYT8_TRYVY|nr:hypothetical protein TRVL_08367 [Trypanosoma vivax]KAH8613806.1 Calponin like (CH) domain [Trypanosoma vivax]CCC49138.1 conserved hypothetical protein [Trypanosoma vivax Y486]
MSLAEEGRNALLPPLIPVNRPGRVGDKESQELGESTGDVDNKVERHRYAKLLQSYVQRYQVSSSITVFVETMLQELARQDGVTPQMRTVAATWTMKLLSNCPSYKPFMEPLVDALFPAIYYKYDVRRLDYAPAAIQAMLCDRNLHRDNPFFSHSTYMHELDINQKRVGVCSKKLTAAQVASEKWKELALLLFQVMQAEKKRRAFLAWRLYTKKRIVDARLRSGVVQRHDAKTRHLCLRTALFRWKTAVEISRGEYLTERLHQAAFQLENAKNQFQMQCFGFDKQCLSYEGLKATLKEVTRERDELLLEVKELKERVDQHLRERQEHIARRVREVVSLVHRQRQTLRGVLDTRFEAKPLIADWLFSEIGQSEDEGNHKQESSPMGHVVLLKWCNYVLALDDAKPRKVSNFSADFCDGGVLYHLLRYTFPDRIPSVSGVNMSTVDCVKRVCDFVASIPLSVTLIPEDFTNMIEDKITRAVAELFVHYIETKRVACANKASGIVAHMETSEVMGSGACGEEVSLSHDEEDMRQHVGAWNAELDKWMGELRENVTYELYLHKNLSSVVGEASFLARERESGNPIRVVTEATAQPFTNIAQKGIEDLRQKRKSRTVQTLKSTTRSSLKNILWKHIRIISSIFYFYAGHDAQYMCESQFWRFIEEKQLIVEPLSAAEISHIFDVVVSPNLMAMIRSNTKEKQAHLMELASDELNIRNVKPSQFSEIIVRMAMVRFSNSLLDSTDRFLASLTLPKLHGAFPDTHSFYTVEAQRVIKYFKEDLVGIYFFYVRKQMLEDTKTKARKVPQGCGRFAAYIHHFTCVQLFQDCGFLTMEDIMDQSGPQEEGGCVGFRRKVGFMSRDELCRMLEGLQQRILALPDGELCFSLFLESLGMVSAYWWPDPTVPYPRKLAAFITDMIGKLRVFHERDTLILKEYPAVALYEGDADHIFQ